MSKRSVLCEVPQNQKIEIAITVQSQIIRDFIT